MREINSASLEKRAQSIKNGTAKSNNSKKFKIAFFVMVFFLVALSIVYGVYSGYKAPFIAVMKEENWNWIFFALLAFVLITIIVGRQIWERKRRQALEKTEDQHPFSKEPD